MSFVVLSMPPTAVMKDGIKMFQITHWFTYHR